MNSLASPRRKFQPRCRWRSSECDLYCVSTPMRRMPEFRQLDSAKSMMRNLPPKYTAGLARRSVSSCSRDPRPPASTSPTVRRGNTCPKLEAALEGKQAGDQVALQLEPADAFGERDESLVRVIPKAEFPPGVKVGGQLEGMTDDGQPALFNVMKIKGDSVHLDGN